MKGKEPSSGLRNLLLQWIPAALLLILCIVNIFANNSLVASLLAIAELLTLIVESRRAGEALRDLRRKFIQTLRTEKEPAPVRLRKILSLSMRMMLPLYAIWLLAGLLSATGGYEAWLIAAFPVLVLSLIPMHLISETWKELMLRRRVFWGVQCGCYILTTIPGTLLVFL